MASETKPKETFRCRKCRFVLFTEEDLSQNHTQKTECLSWYLNDDEDMLEWVQTNVDESGWTEGKLYCPKCNGRVGGFDFLHVVQCSCLADVMPAIWCPKSRIDHIKQAQMKENTQKIRDSERREEQERGSINESLPGSSAKEDSVAENCATGNEIHHQLNVDHFEFGACRRERCSVYDHENPRGNAAEYGARMVMRDADTCQEDFNQQRCCFHDNHGHRPEQISPRSFHHCHACSSHLHCTHNCVECAVQPRLDREHCHIVSNIHESFKEIRREVADFHRDSACGTADSFIENSERAFKRKRDKPRRRGRGNWSYGKEYLDSVQDAKRTKYEAKFGHEVAEDPKMAKYHLDDDYKEISDSEIPDCYKCSVCLSLLHKPQKTPCHHIFCGICLRQLNAITRGRPKCPLCREPIRSVEAEEDMEAEIQIAFPVNYRKRTKEGKKNRHRKSPLPSPHSTAFDTPQEDGEYPSIFRLVHHISIVAMIISIVINSILLHLHGNARARANMQRKIAMFLCIVIGCMLASLLAMCLVIFALDFVKIALFLVVSYVAMTRLIIRAIID